jgi:hypothetical protein
MSWESASPSGSSDRSSPYITTLDASNVSPQAESSISGSKRHDISDSQPTPNLEPDSTPSGLPATARNSNESQSHGRSIPSRRNRSSGGFILDSSVTPSRVALLARLSQDAGSVKGKAKRDSLGLTISKRRNRHSHRSSIGSSPLATKVSTMEDDTDVPIADPAKEGSESQRSMLSRAGNNHSPTLSDKLREPRSKAEPVAIGYDTDPVQIVNLALSLSEGRRRQVSGMRLASGDSGTSHSVSTTSGTYLLATRPESGIGQYIPSKRQFSRNTFPQTHGPERTTSMNTRNKPIGTNGNQLQHTKVALDDLGFESDLYDVSDATFNRVQKARNHFELLYEHRRVLAHLPPLRPSPEILPVQGAEGRAYNPLQYARNRKVRFQEKKPIESDAEGWHDVQRVRTWVNAIIEAHTDRRDNPDECIRLPELHHISSEVGPENTDLVALNSTNPTKRKRESNQNGKPRRPRSDWIISPGDLLADVYWLEQGLNKTKIEDRDGNRIYPWDTDLKFTGWRNRTPAHGQGSQQSSNLLDPVQSDEPIITSPSALPELPSFTSAGRRGKHRGRGRRREKQLRVDLESESSDDGSRRRRKRLHKKLIQSLSRSSTSDSDDEKSSLVPEKTAKLENVESAIEGSVLDHYMRKMLDHDASHFSISLAADRPRSSVERSRSTTKSHIRHSSHVGSSRDRGSSEKRRNSHGRLDSLRDSLDKRRQSRPSLEVERPTRASLDGDTTAPSSPLVPQFPSIAINLSPPASRSPSPTKKVLHSHINPFRGRTQSKHRNGIDTADFAETLPSSSLRPALSDMEKEGSSLNDGSRDTSPMTKSSRRRSDSSNTPSETQRIHSITPRISAKAPSSPDAVSRIRGIFKGGRIAELVGNEVSRVGDFIWKREPPSAGPSSSNASSARTQDGSDTEEEVRTNGSLLKRLPQPHSGRNSTSAEAIGKKIPLSGQPGTNVDTEEKPSYFMSNLPSFTSPFQKDREVQEARDRATLLTPESSPPNTAGDSDHISRAAAHYRSLSKSPRLDRLAPPKLTISRSASTAGSPETRRGSIDFGKDLSLARTTSASRGLNLALGRPRGAFPVTGLTSLHASQSGTQLNTNWNPSVQDTSIKRASTIVTKKDIARTRALLLSSAAKARQISLRSHLIRPQPPKFLLDTLESPSSRTLTSLRVPHKDEQFLAARNLISILTSRSTTFHTSLNHFTSTTSPPLHTSLQALDDLVENKLTPRVRAAADECGELSMKLTTTSTLAVKGLNDVIESAMRRRRRGPVRWLRRFGYGIVEWLVVGLLWGIWLVVRVVRLLVGAVTGCCGVVRWLFWLD